VIVQNANHSFTAPDGTTTPTLGEINQIMQDFLAQYLRQGFTAALTKYRKFSRLEIGSSDYRATETTDYEASGKSRGEPGLKARKN